MNNNGNGQLELQLAGLSSTFRSRGRDSGVEFSTTLIRHVRLQKHENALKTIISDGEVKEDFTRMLKPGGDPAYFIVGMLIWENATFVDSRSRSKGADGLFKLPVSTAVAASTGLVMPDVDPKLATESEATQKRTISGRSEGSSTFALEYRTVRRRIFSIGSNFMPRLGGYGEHIEKDKVFGRSGPKQDVTLVSKDGLVVMDDDIYGVSWTDPVESELDVERVCDLSLAFDR